MNTFFRARPPQLGSGRRTATLYPSEWEPYSIEFELDSWQPARVLIQRGEVASVLHPRESTAAGAITRGADADVSPDGLLLG